MYEIGKIVNDSERHLVYIERHVFMLSSWGTIILLNIRRRIKPTQTYEGIPKIISTDLKKSAWHGTISPYPEVSCHRSETWYVLNLFRYNFNNTTCFRNRCGDKSFAFPNSAWRTSLEKHGTNERWSVTQSGWTSPVVGLIRIKF